MFHVHLRRKCILLHLDGKSWRYQLGPFGLMFHLRFVFPYWFCFDNLSIDDSGVLKSPTIIVLLLISPLMPVQLSSVAQSCPTLCDPIDCSTPGFPVHHQLPEFTQTHVHQVSDGIQPSHPLSFPSPMHERKKWKWSRSVMSDSQRPHGLQPTRLPVHGIFQARVLEWGAIKKLTVTQ